MTSAIYNYTNNAKVWLPMTAACHDPVNVRTLDKSGNGLNFRFGDGVDTGTFPTKLTTRGYSFDGSTDYLIGLANQTNAITTATWAVYFSQSLNSTTYYFYGHSDGVNYRCILLATTTGFRFYTGDVVNYASISSAPLVRQSSFLAGTITSDGYRRIYYNGLIGTPSNVGTVTPSTLVANNPVIGANAGLAQNLLGRIFWFGHWEYALTELQLRDLEARLRRQLNDV